VTEHEPRIYLPESLGANQHYTLTGDQHRHVSRVLRLKAGAVMTLFDGTGGEYGAVIEEVQRSSCTVRTGEFRDLDRESPLPVRLAQGIGRGERTDYAIQKAVELGVTSIIPVLTRRGVVRLDTQRVQRRHAHWHGIVVHACQQCGRNRLPELCPVVTLAEWLRGCDGSSLNLILDPASASSLDELEYGGGLITLLVGPEGGLDDNEREAAYAAGFRGIRLGPRTLRTETAAVAGVTAVQLRWGDLARKIFP
jgi:16S rRNA (uracil1498-N3)-methyltransferase